MLGLPWPIAAGLLAALLLLLVHVRVYAFLTDDAFIAFRYARNLLHGHGLVFNPGLERVEGYSDFLWVVLLAGFSACGVPIEAAANAVSVAATVALWALVVWFCGRRRPPAGREWLLLFPAAALAVSRSFAVWATSGLETRLFELLAVAGVFRLAIEVEEQPRRRAVAPWLFALASLARPDGLLVSACAAGVALLAVARRGAHALGRFAAGWIPFVVLVGAHFAFRLAYYGSWLPNTYYAKVGGHTWWDAGLRYLAAFALEYAALLWVPLIGAAIVVSLRRRDVLLPALVGVVVLPHALYVAAIGGDHFEYRRWISTCPCSSS